MHNLLIRAFLILLMCFTHFKSNAQQIGIALDNNRLYYSGTKDSIQIIKIQNPNDTELQIGISSHDWAYDSSGNNFITDAGALNTSCASWIKISSKNYFLLKPFETKEIEVSLNIPEHCDTSIPVRTALLYFTQLNPTNEVDEHNASLKVTVRSGIKIYHTFNDSLYRNIEIIGFQNNRFVIKDEIQNQLELQISNASNVWVNGTVSMKIINQETGENHEIAPFEFYSLPNDNLKLASRIPENIVSGKYKAIAKVNYNDIATIKIAELEFTL